MALAIPTLMALPECPFPRALLTAVADSRSFPLPCGGLAWAPHCVFCCPTTSKQLPRVTCRPSPSEFLVPRTAGVSQDSLWAETHMLPTHLNPPQGPQTRTFALVSALLTGEMRCQTAPPAKPQGMQAPEPGRLHGRRLADRPVSSPPSFLHTLAVGASLLPAAPRRWGRPLDTRTLHAAPSRLLPSAAGVEPGS